MAYINQNTKDFIINKYKIINLILLLLAVAVVYGIHYYVGEGYCRDFCGLEFKWGTIDPVSTGGKALIPILAFLLLFPGYYFRRWLFFILPVPLILTLLVVSNISVHTSSITVTPRYLAAEYGMYVLGVCTVLYVLWQGWRDWRKSKPR